jgi:3-dehydroquinate dehydratase II
MKIKIINGPNLNLLGKREPEKYGHSSFEDYLNLLIVRFPEISTSDGIILNAGGYTHTSVAIHDAIVSVKTPVIEVHITNIFAREEFRHKSIISAVCKGTISGFGLDSYRLAAEALIEYLKTKQDNK